MADRTRPTRVPSLLGAEEASGGNARLLSATQAAQRLGVSKATLYAYVSRGRLTAVRDPQNARARRYSSFEVEVLMRRQDPARGRELQALAALSEGWPVLDTALSAIVDGQPVYRGRPALALAADPACSLEAVAAWLWALGPHDAFAAPAPVLGPRWQRLAAEVAGQPLAERTLALLACALADLPGPAVPTEGQAAAHLAGAHLRAAFACFLVRPPSAAPLHQQVASAWGLGAAAHEPLRQALVLAADHELNMVGFIARSLTSAGATLGVSLLGAMCTLSAHFNGGSPQQAEALWDELSEAPDLDAAIRQRLAQGGVLPGFNHLAYPAGDPRATRLLALSQQQARLPPLAERVEALTGWKPAIDWGLVALRRALGAPADAAQSLQMAGRCVGVIAHVLEQRRSGERIMPRARYVGPLP